MYVLLQAGDHGEAYEVQKEAAGYELELNLSVEEARATLRKDKDTSPTKARINLPHQVTRFVGREQELSEVGELLAQPDHRLVSLVAVGGVGKTRLALQTAQQQLEEGNFPDGVVFVPLEALSEAVSLPAVVAGALGLTLMGQEDAGRVVKRFLVKKKLLLVLDNFEQLLEGSSFVRELIDHCPRLKLLITSRERLNLEVEWVYTLEGLAYPEEGISLEQAEPFDAVELFVERAKQAQHSFSLTSATLPAVTAVCRLVDGMPLAIELAASWLRALPAIEVVRELESGIDLLESPARDIPERHRGVRVVFDHSWTLLSEGEREILRRLSVFRGGFMRAAADLVSGASLPLLADLVDKSMLSMSVEGRYDRHPLLSQYTREKLAEHPEEWAEAEERHGSYFLGLVRGLEPDLWTLERKKALRVFLEELANIRAAWEWAVENLEVDEIEQTIPAMYDFFTIRLTEGLEYFGTTFEFFGSVAERLDENNPKHAGALGSLLIHQVLDARIMHRSPDYLRMQSLAERGLELLESLGEPRGLARGYLALGQSFHHTGKFTEATDWYQRALVVARKHGSSSDIALVLKWLSWLLQFQTSRYPQYRQLVPEVLEELRALNHLPGVILFLIFSGDILESEQRFEEAKAFHLEAIRLAEELGHHELGIISLIPLAKLSIGLGEFDQAAAYARDAHRQAEETGLTLLLPDTLAALGWVATAQGDFEEARELLLRSLKMAWKRTHVGALVASLVALAKLLAAEGNPSRAVALLKPYSGTIELVRRQLAELEGLLTPEEFEAALERGRGMTRDDVIRELLPEL
jgi:predicted ATPase